MRMYGKYALIAVTLFFILFNLISLSGLSESAFTEPSFLLRVTGILYILVLSLIKKSVRTFKKAVRSPPLS
jgi:hypothetical protein